MVEVQELKAEIDPEIKRLLHNWYCQYQRKKMLPFKSEESYVAEKAYWKSAEKSARKELFEEMERQVWRP